MMEPSKRVYVLSFFLFVDTTEKDRPAVNTLHPRTVPKSKQLRIHSPLNIDDRHRALGEEKFAIRWMTAAANNERKLKELKKSTIGGSV
ncbi:hypothetical protein MHYP_G00327480 [Metynnis hypsauchen]